MLKRHRYLRSALFASLVLGPLGAQTPTPLPSLELESIRTHESFRQGQALDHAIQLRSQLGLGPEHGFQSTRTFTNAFGQTHVRMQQTFKGIKVFGGEVIARFKPSGSIDQMLDHTLKTNFSACDPTPSFSNLEALNIAKRAMALKAEPTYAPKVELVYVQDDGRPRSSGGLVTGGKPGPHLAYHVHIAVEAPENFGSNDFLVDAHSGQILRQWDSLQTHRATVKGKGFYNPSVEMNIEVDSDGVQFLQDTTRGTQPHPIYGGLAAKGNIFLNLHHADDPFNYQTGLPSYAWGELYTIGSGTPWGDGTLYQDQLGVDGSLTPSGLSVAVDAYEGTAKTWDFYSKILGWKGIDNKDSAAITRIHSSHQYANAFWSDDCFCMTYGDGSPFWIAPLVTLDIIGHEISHGVTASMGGLIYYGESGGLNESMSDIFGKMTETWAKGGQGDSVPEMSNGVNWREGSVLLNYNAPTDTSLWLPFRYMNHPSLDGLSADAWSPGMELEDVHYTSGPMNRAFYFLSQGASSSPDKAEYSTFTPSGFTGIGNDKAIRIVFQARQTLPQTATYADARNACISAAQQLFGDAEVTAVKNAFGAINVGLPSSPLNITRKNSEPWDHSIGGMLAVGSSATYVSEDPTTSWTILEGAKAGSLTTNANSPGEVAFKAGTTPGIYHLQAQGGVDTTTFAVMVLNPDLNGDGAIDTWDLAIQAYGTNNAPVNPDQPGMDLNGDGVVNGFDICMIQTIANNAQ